MKLSGKDLVVLFFCRQLQSVLLTTHPQQQLFFYIATTAMQVQTPPQLLPSNRKTAASVYSTALTGPPESKTYPKILRKIETKYPPKNQIVNPGKTKHFASQSPF